MGSAKTRFSISDQPVLSVQADALIIPVLKRSDNATDTQKQDKKQAAKSNHAASVEWPSILDKTLLKELSAIANDEKFDGEKGKILTLRHSAGHAMKARRLILLGLGKSDKLQHKHWEINLQKALSAFLGLKDPNTVAILLPAATLNLSVETLLSLAVDATYQATYQSTEAKEPGPDLQKVILVSTTTQSNLAAVLKQAESLSGARSLVKDLVNYPSNLKNTNTLVEQAKRIGKNSAVLTKVQSSVSWIEKNMPCFFTVAKGSLATDPPQFITLQYTPPSGKAKKRIAIVGKSVIFDTGGYQVKPGDYMVTMKGDMTGGAVVLATMQALSELRLQNISVSAYLAATPNKIDSDAMIPDSIVNTTCGKKVEIRHTDAEGRLTLIDAVAKAAEEKPDEIITIATLTGSASQAVGYSIALMGNDHHLRDRIEASARSLGEPVQTLDVNEEDYENIKSKLDGADLINTSQRKHRGAQSAAAFVMSGAPENMAMAHLDIAGADMTADEKATGTSVKTIIQYLINEDRLLAKDTVASVPQAPTRKTLTAKPTPKKSEITPKTASRASAASSKKTTQKKAVPMSASTQSAALPQAKVATAPAKAKPGSKPAVKGKPAPKKPVPGKSPARKKGK